MIRLDTTTRKLQLILGGAVSATQPDIAVSYSDKTSTTYTGGTQVSVGNSGTAVDICGAPAASTVRDVDHVNVRNNDSAAIVTTIRFNDNATLYKLITVTLAVGDSLEYTHASGWRVLDSTGSIKQSASATIADASITVAKLANGTDGQLITWDSAGVATTVATGTATHVLTSNGAGAAPTFQAPAAGATGTLVKFTQINASNASWAKQASTTAIICLCVGGGGNGGPSDGTTLGTGGTAGAGAWGYVASGAASTYNVTIGGAGGATSFGAVASAAGGRTGIQAIGAALPGESGINGVGGTAGAGAAGANSGAGGGGATASGAGGAGGSGVCFVWEFA